MTEYNNGKIYEIVCNITGERYIGSTVQTLEKRLSRHKQMIDSCSSEQILIKENYCMNLLENYPCNSKTELIMKEREWYDKLENINKLRPHITIEEHKEYQKEYHIDNAVVSKEYYKEYYKDNKEKMKQYKLENATEIKEYQRQYQKEYRIANKEKQKEYRKQYLESKTTKK